MHATDTSHSHTPSRMTGPLGFWFRTPLFLRITLGLVIGVSAGLILGPFWHADASPKWMLATTRIFSEVSRLTLRLLGAIAPALILFAVLKSLISTDIKGRVAARLIWLLLLNTTVAICVGLVVANVLKPGADSRLAGGDVKITHTDPLTDFLNSVPSSLLAPLVENNSIGVIILAISFGLAARKLPAEKKTAALKGVVICFDLIVLVLYWALELVPLAVMCKVAFITTTLGFSPFKSLGRFVLAVLLALVLQSCYYMIRMRFLSWVRPLQLLGGIRDALVMAFSTDSSAATMPLTYECMINRVGIRQENASLGVLVGGNFNHDGTALYQAMSTLFIAQLLGLHLSLVQQFMVVVTGVVASVGMAGIPEAGLVTMALIFNAVGLPVADIALLLPIDWFLDRCRTAINVLGDTSVACLLDGKTKTTNANPSAEHLPEPLASLAIE